MRTINKNELIDVIKSIPSRSCEDKPILIYNWLHSGPNLFIELMWYEQFGRIAEFGRDLDPTPEEGLKKWSSDQYKFLKVILENNPFLNEHIKQCVQLQKESKKPMVVLVTKLANRINLKIESLQELFGDEMYSFIENKFEVYDYDYNQELAYITQRSLSLMSEESRKEYAEEFAVPLFEK